MPYFSIETNQTIDPAANREFMQKTSGFIAELMGKPEAYVMIAIKPETPLIFGNSEEPAAFVQLKNIGLQQDRCAEFSGKICSFIERELKIPKDRVFIDFKELNRKLFGWNGKTF